MAWLRLWRLQSVQVAAEVELDFSDVSDPPPPGTHTHKHTTYVYSAGYPDGIEFLLVYN